MLYTTYSVFLINTGTPTVREVTISNLSVVPVTFSLVVLSDGRYPSISYNTFASAKIKPRVSDFPKEFQIEPRESIVEPFSCKKVTVI